MTYYIKNAEALAAKVEAAMRAQPGYNFVPAEIIKRIEAGLEIGHIFRGVRYEGGNHVAKLNEKGEAVATHELSTEQIEAFAAMALEAAAMAASKKGYGF